MTWSTETLLDGMPAVLGPEEQARDARWMSHALQWPLQAHLSACLKRSPPAKHSSGKDACLDAHLHGLACHCLAPQQLTVALLDALQVLLVLNLELVKVNHVQHLAHVLF